MKIKEFQKNLKTNNLGASVLFYKDPNFFYFTQEKLNESVLVIPAKGESFILISHLEKTNNKIRKNSLLRKLPCL